MSATPSELANVPPKRWRRARVRIVGVEDDPFGRIDAQKYRRESVVFPSRPEKSASVHAAAFHGFSVYQNMQPLEVVPAGVLRPLQQQPEQRQRGRDHDELAQLSKQLRHGHLFIYRVEMFAESWYLERRRFRFGDQRDWQIIDQRSLEEFFVFSG